MIEGFPSGLELQQEVDLAGVPLPLFIDGIESQDTNTWTIGFLWYSSSTSHPRSMPSTHAGMLTISDDGAETNHVIRLQVNGNEYQVDVDPAMPLLWVLRDELRLTGTKFGCGIGLCGSCAVLVDGVAQRACSISIGDLEGEVTTIEGLGTPEAPHPLQQAWIDHQVAQCGYCQPGQIITAASLLAENPTPTEAEIDAALSDNLCRCATYVRIKQVVRAAADRLSEPDRPGDT